MTSSRAQTLAVVREALARFAANDVEGLLKLLDDDVEWQEPDTGGRLPWSGYYRGKSGVLIWLQALGAVDDLKIEPREFLADGDRVVVLARETGRMRATGRAFDSDLALVFTVAGGRITAMRVFANTAAQVEAATAH
ncbi:nuclear transport factor 2 family protein [Azospirillum sp.]|uniref:nuclear transport factor 2 family protein n=1 Tax=Azospirillum sp. TaxID=34012 RepID=UPI002D71FA7D|nr:nuclear transport factor 2 family protein [Azospirillum sp.]HYD67436.1 nuclear transport factor 2 family protein [Azospirillum sp.]